MKISDILNITNIKHFIEGNAKYYYDKFFGLPQHIREQVLYRLEQCKDDCVIEGKCKVCDCPVDKKVFQSESCNKEERFPDLMDNVKWEKFKKENNYE